MTWGADQPRTDLASHPTDLFVRKQMNRTDHPTPQLGRRGGADQIEEPDLVFVLVALKVNGERLDQHLGHPHGPTRRR